MDTLQVQDRYSMILDILLSTKDRVESIFDYVNDKDFKITDKENEDFINAIKYHIETVQRYL
jgi:hypothetical protein